MRLPTARRPLRNLSREGLKGKLRQIVEAEDRWELEARIEPLLQRAGTVQEVLECLLSGELRGDLPESGSDRLADGEMGALIVLGAAVTASHLKAVRRPFAMRRMDGRGLLRSLLRALPQLSEAAAQVLGVMLGDAEVKGRLLLGLEFGDEVLRLRSASPERRACFDTLLQAMGAGLSGGARRSFYSLFLEAGRDPDLVPMALPHLLKGTVGDASHLERADSLLADAADDSEILLATCHEVARSAEVNLAAVFLLDRAHLALRAEFAALGMREGGTAALHASYEQALLPADDLVRRMLVSGMVLAEEAALLHIASSDPSEAVRGEALDVLAIRIEEPSLEFLALIGHAHASGRLGTGAPGGSSTGISFGMAIRIYCDVAWASRGSDAAVHADALRRLKCCARDLAEPLGTRRLALETLKGYLDTPAYAELELWFD